MTVTALFHDGPADGQMIERPTSDHVLFIPYLINPQTYMQAGRRAEAGLMVEYDTATYERVSETVVYGRTYAHYDYMS